MARLAQFLHQLDQRALPAHVTPVTRMMFQEISSNLPFPTGLMLWQLLNPMLTGLVLKLLGSKGKVFEPLFRHTVNATIVRGGEKVNVIPSEVVVDIDGRLLPGYRPEDLVAELRQLIRDDVELEFTRHDVGPAEPDMGLFSTLKAILREADPAGTPVPMLLPAATDGRLFAKLGIQTYGFLPMPLPTGFSFLETIHGANERIPVDSLNFGAQAIYQLLQRFGDA
jgi:acetylornithine deacetylase/succinyl-diaminopimelate desuccinylase-like protein